MSHRIAIKDRSGRVVKIKDRSGQVIGNFKFIRYIIAGRWLVECKFCGKTKERRYGDIVFAHIKYCGCLPCRKSNIKENYKEYGLWNNICRKEEVCDRWLMSFDNFLEDIEKKPKGKFNFKKIKKNKPFSKENYQWVRPGNPNKILVKSKSLADIAKENNSLYKKVLEQYHRLTIDKFILKYNL